MAKIIDIQSKYKYFDYILPIYFVLAFFQFYMGAWGISTIVKYPVFLFLLIYGLDIYRKVPNNTGFKKLFSIFFGYYVLSIIWYSVNGVPVECYLNELFNAIPAMFFVYIGMTDNREDNRFYKFCMWSCTIAMVIGMFLYVTTPSWFIQRCVEFQALNTSIEYNANQLMNELRFSSFFGDTYEADMYAVLALVISFFFYFIETSSKKQLLYLAFVLINLAAAILTQQRSAMAAATIIAVFFLYKGYCTKHGKLSNKIVLFAITVLICGSAILISKFPERMDLLTELLSDRMENMDVGDAMKERNNQPKFLFANWYLPIFGHGAGSGGSVAYGLGKPGVTDGAYYVLLYEMGIVGSLLFLTIVFKTVRRAFRYYRIYIAELMLMFFVFVASLGANTLYIGFLGIFPLWYAVGRIWNTEYLYRTQLSKKHL